MPQPAFELADIFRRYGAAYREAHKLPREQRRVTFQWKDYRHKDKQRSRTMTVSACKKITLSCSRS